MKFFSVWLLSVMKVWYLFVLVLLVRFFEENIFMVDLNVFWFVVDVNGIEW